MELARIGVRNIVCEMLPDDVPCITVEFIYADATYDKETYEGIATALLAISLACNDLTKDQEVFMATARELLEKNLPQNEPV